MPIMCLEVQNPCPENEKSVPGVFVIFLWSYQLDYETRPNDTIFLSAIFSTCNEPVALPPPLFTLNSITTTLFFSFIT